LNRATLEFGCGGDRRLQDRYDQMGIPYLPRAHACVHARSSRRRSNRPSAYDRMHNPAPQPYLASSQAQPAGSQKTLNPSRLVLIRIDSKKKSKAKE
jgi:hypothetical protein